MPRGARQENGWTVPDVCSVNGICFCISQWQGSNFLCMVDKPFLLNYASSLGLSTTN